MTDQAPSDTRFNWAGKPFHLLGYTDDDGFGRAAVTDGDEMFAPVDDDGGVWVAICQDCPMPWDARYGYRPQREWEFKVVDRVVGAESARSQAEAFAQRHHDLQGHTVKCVSRITYTFRLYDDGSGDPSSAYTYAHPDLLNGNNLGGAVGGV